MSSLANLGDLSISGVTASNKNALSLANFSADFTLIKFEPPAEYSALGKALSPARRQNAEDGPAHRTARRLGALFQQIIPSTPKLVEAYGHRATEIIETPGLNPRGSKHDGAFEKYVGMDCTTIWAAVTSGTASLGVHLLSCMLARAWEPKEAIAIWVELVECRQNEIARFQDQQRHIVANETAIAARQEITREELALWDNGARSWLRQADRAKPRDFDRFRLIAANAGVAYPTGGAGPSLYKSVVETWTQSMLCAENLFKELPQQVSDRGILLAISAWHLYPDLAVFGGSTSAPPKVVFNDPLVPSRAVLTVGLERCSPVSEDTDRIKWSLALSHLHYYGNPVKVLSNEDTTRISMVELQVIALGYLLAQWSDVQCDWHELDTLAWLKGLWDLIKQHADSRSAYQTSNLELAELRWLSVLATASSHVLETATPVLNDSTPGPDSSPASATRLSSADQTRNEPNWSHFKMNTKCKQLLNFGKRRGAEMIGNTPHCPGDYGLFFGLCNPLAYAAFEEELDCDVGVRYLREIASSMELKCDEAVICFSRVEKGICYYEYATAARPSPEHPHGRWIQAANFRNSTAVGWDQAVPPRLFSKISVSESCCDCPGYCLETCPCSSKMQQCRPDCHPSGGAHRCSNSIMEIHSRVRSLRERGEDVRLSRDLMNLSDHTPSQRLVSETLDLPIPQSLLPSQLSLIPSIRWNDPPTIFTTRHISSAPAHACSRPLTPGGSCNCFAWTSTGTEPVQKSASFALCFSFLGSKSSGGGFELWIRDWPNFESPVNWVPRYSQQILYAQGLLTSPKFGLDWLKSGTARSCWIWDYIRIISVVAHKADLTKKDYQPHELEHGWAPWKLNTSWAAHMISNRSHITPTYFDSMSILGIAAEVYQELPHATIPTKILRFPLIQAHWAQRFINADYENIAILSLSRRLPRPEVFACIAMFETGRINLRPDELSSVFAICVENSIFAAGILFSDPAEWPSGKNIRHIIGNTGHSGLVLLAAPNNPRIRQPSDDYTVTQYDQYDLKQEDNFQKTSLHLSFTKWKFPIPVGDGVGTSSIDHEVQFVEAVIELWDGKDWVADLDVLGLERFGHINLIPHQNKQCVHQHPSLDWQRNFTSLDVWEELLEPPEKVGIFRAHGNWVARLGAVSILIQRNLGRRVLVLGESSQTHCWGCIRREMQNGRPVMFVID